MIEQFATICCAASSELLDLNHAGNSLTLASLVIPRFACAVSVELGRTSEFGTLAMAVSDVLAVELHHEKS